jgi:hypothetical protein
VMFGADATSNSAMKCSRAQVLIQQLDMDLSHERGQKHLFEKSMNFGRIKSPGLLMCLSRRLGQGRLLIGGGF